MESGPGTVNRRQNLAMSNSQTRAVDYRLIAEENDPNGHLRTIIQRGIVDGGQPGNPLSLRISTVHRCGTSLPIQFTHYQKTHMKVETPLCYEDCPTEALVSVFSH